MEVCIGKVVRTRGLRGELIIYFLITKHDCKKGDLLFFDNKSNVFGPYEVEYLNFYKSLKEKSLHVLKLKEINSIEEGSLLKGCFIIKNFEHIPDSIFFKADIIGSKIVLKDKNLIIGKVRDIIRVKEDYNILLVKTRKKEEIFIPFTKEVVFKVDPQRKRIFVDSLEGVLEEYV